MGESLRFLQLTGSWDYVQNPPIKIRHTARLCGWEAHFVLSQFNRIKSNPRSPARLVSYHRPPQRRTSLGPSSACFVEEVQQHKLLWSEAALQPATGTINWLSASLFLFFLKRLRKVAKKKVLLASSCLSVCVEQLGSHWTVSRNLIFEYFSKICQENLSFIKIWQH
jgi:hypothetical protein